MTVVEKKSVLGIERICDGKAREVGKGCFRSVELWVGVCFVP
jgi:hypothetical protein